MRKYHVALSFAGEDRAYVERVAEALKAEGVSVFYDRFEEAGLWGKDLYEHLSEVYGNSSMFTVMFVSSAYRDKVWTTHERRSAQARAFTESSEYILPALFDVDIEVPGLRRTTGYIDLKKKTPGELASLIVEKLNLSGVKLSNQFEYSDAAKADIDFAAPKRSDEAKLIKNMRSYTWDTQRPAVEAVLLLDESDLPGDTIFVLGRNIYQCACGSERRAAALLTNLRSELAKLDLEFALHLLNGMLFEAYFNKSGEFREKKLKATYLPELLAVQKVKKFAPSILFIRRALEPYRASLAFLPSALPETVEVRLKVRRSDPPSVTSLKVSGEELLIQIPDDEDEPIGPFWRFNHGAFTLEQLGEQITQEWGVPTSQLDIAVTPAIATKAKMRLSEGYGIKFLGQS